MHSMTGHASSQVALDNFQLYFEINSYNSRSVYVHCDLPRECLHYEPLLRKHVLARVRRGTIRVKMLLVRSKSAECVVDWERLRSLHQAYTRVVKELGLDHSITLRDLMSEQPFVSEALPDLGACSSRVEEAFAELLDSFVHSRYVEGMAVCKLIEDLMQSTECHVQKICAVQDSVLDKSMQRLRKRIMTTLGGDVDEPRLLMEVSVLAARLDFHEELKRFLIHLKNFQQLCSEHTVRGKKLEFLYQEMFREITTISVKANDITVSSAVVEIKYLLEQIKEHLGNIE